MHPVHGNPRTGLLRTFWEPDWVLRSPFRGLCVQGALNWPSIYVPSACWDQGGTSNFQTFGASVRADFRVATNPHPSPGTNGTKWRFYCEIKQHKAGLSQGRVPICPGEGSHLSQGRFLFVPDTVPPKMFMFIGLFLARNFSVFRVRRFSEWPEPLHWIAFPVEILTKPLIHWIACPLFTENPFFSTENCFVASAGPKIGSDSVEFPQRPLAWEIHFGNPILAVLGVGNEYYGRSWYVGQGWLRLRLRAENQKVSKKVSKKSPGAGSQKSEKKVSKKVRKVKKEVGKWFFGGLFGPFSRLFWDFWDPAFSSLFWGLLGFRPWDSLSQVRGTSRLWVQAP